VSRAGAADGAAIARPRRVALALAALLAAGALPPAAARAATEEFSTFDVAVQELDDESLLDHFLTRPPIEWRDEWERSPQAIRTSQGCLTSGQWFIQTDLKVRSALGRHAQFGLDLKQSENDAASYDHLDFSFLFPTRWGTPGLMFRPLHDKSRQDFGILYEWGGDTTAFQLQAAFVFEDMFNNLWSFRQSQVGERAEPYTRHPYEPGLRWVVRQPAWRAEMGARYLTPSVKRLGTGAEQRVATLWGALEHVSLELEALGCDWEARAVDVQAKSTESPLDGAGGNARNFRRRWSAEAAVRRRLGGRVTVEGRWLYQQRDQSLGPPLGPAFFRGIDRLLALEAHVALTPTLTVQLGGLHDQITILKVGDLPASYGSRRESRAFVGLMARFGRVSLSGVEGIELDPEPYEVWGVHDKGFVHLQATF
jgi:hypothetical protein